MIPSCDVKDFVDRTDAQRFSSEISRHIEPLLDVLQKNSGWLVTTPCKSKSRCMILALLTRIRRVDDLQ